MFKFNDSYRFSSLYLRDEILFMLHRRLGIRSEKKLYFCHKAYSFSLIYFISKKYDELLEKKNNSDNQVEENENKKKCESMVITRMY